MVCEEAKSVKDAEGNLLKCEHSPTVKISRFNKKKSKKADFYIAI
jgi:hypothetical protein